MKKLVSEVLILLLVLALAAPVLAAGKKADRSVEGNLVKITTAGDFAAGELDGLVVDETVGNGALRLSEGSASGTFVSEVIGVEPFEYLVASWNADMPQGAQLEVYVRAYVDTHKEWSSWMGWGKWRADIRRGSSADEDSLAFMDVDTLTILGSSGETASLVQMKAVLTASAAGESPVLRQLAATYKNTLEGQAIKPLVLGAGELPASVRLDTPAYSQMIRRNSIANVICSATTVCVLLNDRGEDAMPEEIALINYDKNYEGFGNWSYSIAAAGAYGYDAYCQYGDLDLVRRELADGYSVGLSVRYSNTPSGSYPYLENAPTSTAGHLITITGYETVDGVDYFFSSDSAADSDAASFRRYRADQLDAAWVGRMMYVVHEKEAAPAYLPGRIAAELVPAEGTPGYYALMVDGEVVTLDSGLDGKMLRGEGGGTIVSYIEEEAVPAMPDNAKTTAANHRMSYAIGVKDGLLRIDTEGFMRGASGPRTLRVLVMLNNGTTYEAALALEAAPETPAPAPEPTPAETEAAAPVAPEEPGTPVKTGNGALYAILGAAALAVIAIVALAVKKNGKAKK